jgi:hypothetical protein
MNQPMKFHLAQVNVAYAKGPQSDAVMKGFNDRLDEINTLADKSPGFIWRYVTDSRDPLDRVFSDPLILYNLSVWESPEALHYFTYKTVHAELYAGRRQWFEEWRPLMKSAFLAMWWVNAGHIPTVQESKERLALLSEKGPTPLAFHFKQRFSPGE